MIRLSLYGLLASVMLFGCAQTTVGIPCVDRDDCEPAQDCFPAPAGFCTRGCSEPGQVRDCPSGTICTFFGQSLVCSPPCEIDRDCRINFECALTHAGGTKSACRPAPP